MLRELMRRGWFPNGPRFGFRVERAGYRFRQHEGEGEEGGEGGGSGGGSGGGEGGEGGEGGGGSGGGSGGGDPSEKKFSQNDFDSAMKKARVKQEKAFQVKQRETLAELEKAREAQGLSAAHAKQLDGQITTLRADLMSEGEKAAAEKDRVSNEHKRALDAVTGERDALMASKVAADIDSDINAASTTHEVVNAGQILDILRPRSALVEITDEDGKGTGKHKVVVTDMVKDGDKMVKKDFTTDEYLAHLKADAKNANLFKQTRKGGTGYRPGTGGGAGGDKTSGMTANEKIDAGLRKGQAGVKAD